MILGAKNRKTENSPPPLQLGTLEYWPGFVLRLKISELIFISKFGSSRYVIIVLATLVKIGQNWKNQSIIPNSQSSGQHLLLNRLNVYCPNLTASLAPLSYRQLSHKNQMYNPVSQSEKGEHRTQNNGDFNYSGSRIEIWGLREYEDDRFYLSRNLQW